jgi:hypothetical protein
MQSQQEMRKLGLEVRYLQDANFRLAKELKQLLLGREEAKLVQ